MSLINIKFYYLKKIEIGALLKNSITVGDQNIPRGLIPYRKLLILFLIEIYGDEYASIIAEFKHLVLVLGQKRARDVTIILS